MSGAAMRSIGWSVVLIFLAVDVVSSVSAGGAMPQQETSVPPPVVLTAEQDHQRMMELLHITSLRPGANPNDPKAPNAVNYDEAKANPYPNLPDLLVLKNGKRVTTAQAWWTKR